jgi:hypothetical protein
MILIYEKNTNMKHIRSENYNYSFNPDNGYFARWGKTLEDNPEYGPLEILDMEVSTVCFGIPTLKNPDIPTPCKFCYKGNTKVGKNMSFETFKKIFDCLPKTLTQIAFGIGNIDANPDLFKMMDYCRNNKHIPNVVPNITINGFNLTDEIVNILYKNVGGIAVSRYENKDVCYNAVKKLTDIGISQVNIHQVIAEESLNDCYQLINDVVEDDRLSKLKAVVFLTLKPKGKRNKWNTLKNIDEYKKLIEYAFSKNVKVGFDSCSAPTFLASMKDNPLFNKFVELSESCESTLFSGYINVDGKFFPCSFTEDENDWKNGIDVTLVNDFHKEVWNHERVANFRKSNINTTLNHICGDCRTCVTFPNLYDKRLKKVL